MISVILHVYSPSSPSVVGLICRLPLARKSCRESAVMTTLSCSQDNEAGEVVVNVQSKRAMASVVVRTSSGSTSNTTINERVGMMRTLKDNLLTNLARCRCKQGGDHNYDSPAHLLQQKLSSYVLTHTYSLCSSDKSGQVTLRSRE